MHKIIVITGPTGVGKTKLSIELAKRLNGEIINADAMQVYRNLDIGTAKITEEEKENIPHHLFDIKEVNEEYTIYHYQKDCRKIIEEISKKNKTPIIVGGSALYIKSALYDYELLENKIDHSKYDELSDEELYKKLITIDKKAENNIDKHNRRRVLNAICYYEKNNKSITDNHTEKLLYEVSFIGLTTDREKLYKIINNRVDRMIESGLIDEVKSFYDKNILTKPILNGIGYKEIIEYLKGNYSKEEAIEEIKKNSRHYAKRQYTFLKHQLPIKWFEVNIDNFNKTIEEVYNYLKKEEG